MEGCTVRIDEQGQLCVSGERLCARYFGGECLTEVATGDLARLDDDGRIVLLGRLKDMIIRGRSNIYPALYEDGIAEIPGVSRCALIGVWDSRLGDERVVLAVEPAVGEKNTAGLRRRVEHALQSHPIIDSFAVPDEIVITPLPESGRAHKVDRNALRKTLGDLC